MLPLQLDPKTITFGIGALAVAVVACLSVVKWERLKKCGDENPGFLQSLVFFCWSCFVKPHESGSGETQQDALESFYKIQANVYDSTRRVLLKGREDMLSLVAAQLAHKAKHERPRKKMIWVDVSTSNTSPFFSFLLFFSWAGR